MLNIHMHNIHMHNMHMHIGTIIVQWAMGNEQCGTCNWQWQYRTVVQRAAEGNAALPRVQREAARLVAWCSVDLHTGSSEQRQGMGGKLRLQLQCRNEH